MRPQIRCCDGCDERRVGCHAECSRYQEEKAAHEQLKQEERRNRKARYDIDAYEANRQLKLRKFDERIKGVTR